MAASAPFSLALAFISAPVRTFPSMTFETCESFSLCSSATARPAGESRANASVAKAGTVDANLGIGRVSSASVAQPRLSGRGGARLRADRVSHHLSAGQAQSIIIAGQRALAMGKPFTRHTTIHWSRAGIPDDQAAEATGAMIKLASGWTRSKREVLLWAWARENERNGKGSHVHILLACPSHLPIGRMWRRWLRKVTARPYRAGVIKTTRIGRTLDCWQTSPQAYRVNLDAITAYLCKGIDPAHADALGLPRHSPGGPVIGKRASVCQALGNREAKSAGPTRQVHQG